MSTTSLYNKVYKDKTYNDRSDSKIKFVKDWIEENYLEDVLDVGCGRGHYLKETGATGLEPSNYVCENDLKRFHVINSDILGSETSHEWEGLYCMDVLEHISHEDIDMNLKKLAELAPKALYGIANHSDFYLGTELHLIQEDANWWYPLLKKYYKNVRLTYEPQRYFVFETERCSQ